MVLFQCQATVTQTLNLSLGNYPLLLLANAKYTSGADPGGGCRLREGGGGRGGLLLSPERLQAASVML